MFFLLPQKNKKVLRREYHLRRWTVFLALLFFTIIIAIVLLVPTYVTLKFNNQQKSNELEIKEQTIEKMLNPEAIYQIERVSNQLDKITGISENILFSLLIEAVLERVPNDVLLNNLSLKRGSDEEGIKIFINGRAENRNALLEFSESLLRNELFLETDISIDEFSRGVDIDFNFSVTAVTKKP